MNSFEVIIIMKMKFKYPTTNEILNAIFPQVCWILTNRGQTWIYEYYDVPCPRNVHVYTHCTHTLPHTCAHTHTHGFIHLYSCATCCTQIHHIIHTKAITSQVDYSHKNRWTIAYMYLQQLNSHYNPHTCNYEQKVDEDPVTWASTSQGTPTSVYVAWFICNSFQECQKGFEIWC